MKIWAAVFCLVILLTGGYEIAAQAVEYTGHRFKDPFYKINREENSQISAQSPLSVRDTTGGKEAYVLEGMIWNAAKPMAIVNGRIVKTGDKIGNAEVLQIEKEGVKMKEFDRDFTLSKDTRKSR